MSLDYRSRNETWPEIFDALGVRWCKRCDKYLQEHAHGLLTTQFDYTPSEMPRVVEEVFHWRDRRETRTSTYKAIRKIAEGRNPWLKALPPWRGLYLLHAEIKAEAARAGRRFPHSYADLDRARLRYMLSEYRQVDRRRMTKEEQRDFRAAIRWAAR